MLPPFNGARVYVRTYVENGLGKHRLLLRNNQSFVFVFLNFLETFIWIPLQLPWFRFQCYLWGIAKQHLTAVSRKEIRNTAPRCLTDIVHSCLGIKLSKTCVQCVQSHGRVLTEAPDYAQSSALPQLLQEMFLTVKTSTWMNSAIRIPKRETVLLLISLLFLKYLAKKITLVK